jgi:outer membrane protein assembly factor BamE (lipoprotein component of BamABCDE complex)
MHNKPARLLCLALLCSTTPSLASSVQRCEDATGNITFTSLGCPSGQDMQWQEAYNAPPGTNAGTRPATAPRNRPTRPPSNRSQELVIVGQHDDGCGNRLSAEQRRRAIINKQTPPGMTRKDVENLLGRPDRVISRNGETRYVYHEKKGRSSQVTFDENGCVQGKR